MSLLKAFRDFKKTTPYSRKGLYEFEAAFNCPDTREREFCSIDKLPEEITEFIIDVYELTGQVGFRDREWIHSFSALWDGKTLKAKAIG